MAPPPEDKARLERHSADVERFIELLVAAASGSRASVVITLRAHFYNPLIRNPLLAALLPKQQVNIPPMSRDDLRAAIETPAKTAGLSFAPPELVDRILDDVGLEEGRLPLLQFALKETWQERKGDRLTAEAYTAVGGVARAIEKTAEDAYERLTPEQKDATRPPLPAARHVPVERRGWVTHGVCWVNGRPEEPSAGRRSGRHPRPQRPSRRPQAARHRGSLLQPENPPFGDGPASGAGGRRGARDGRGGGGYAAAISRGSVRLTRASATRSTSSPASARTPSVASTRRSSFAARPIARRLSSGRASASASPSLGQENGILRAETRVRFQAQNAGERPEFCSQTALRLANRPKLREFLWNRKPRRFAGTAWWRTQSCQTGLRDRARVD